MLNSGGTQNAGLNNNTGNEGRLGKSKAVSFNAAQDVAGRVYLASEDDARPRDTRAEAKQYSRAADPTGSRGLAINGPRGLISDAASSVVAAENGVSYVISDNKRQNDNAAGKSTEKLEGNLDASGSVQEQSSISLPEGRARVVATIAACILTFANMPSSRARIALLIASLT